MTGVTADDDLYSTETFGPLVGVARFSTFDEAIELANDHGYGLSSAIYTTSPTHAFRFRERISAGMVSVNNSTSGAEAHLPFGGNGKSGNGSRQSGVWVLDQFTRWQSMNWDYAGKLQKAQMDLVEIEADRDFRLEERAFVDSVRRCWTSRSRPSSTTCSGGSGRSSRRRRLPAEAEIEDPADLLASWHVVERLRDRARERGIYTPHLPEEWGGLGVGALGMALISQECGVVRRWPRSASTRWRPTRATCTRCCIAGDAGADGDATCARSPRAASAPASR